MLKFDSLLRFYLPVLFLALLGVWCGQKLIRAHVTPSVTPHSYVFERSQLGRRGTIYASGGTESALVKSVPVWEYRLDPVDLTNRVVKFKGQKTARSREAILKTVSQALKLDYQDLKRRAENVGNRYQYLATSSDQKAHDILVNQEMVAGVASVETQTRRYMEGRLLSHVLGFVNAENVGSAGIELKYNKELCGVAGLIKGMRDGRGRELREKRIQEIEPVPGGDVYLTIDRNLQYEAETALADGVAQFGASAGWCIVLDSKTAAVLAMASFPDYDPMKYFDASDSERMNRTIGFNYEPGSVMKVITAAAAVNEKMVTADTRYSSDPKVGGYPSLPTDSHGMDPVMTVRDGIIHSSNVVIGKIAYDLGPRRLWSYQRGFGFGQRTGIGLPGEETGILHNWKNWDIKTRSRAGIGQGVSVTAIQLASAYQAIANNGVRMRPYIVSKVISAEGDELYSHLPEVVGRPIGREASASVREMMLGVAVDGGTARRAAMKGYSIAGKTGTAQKVVNGHYSKTLYYATFCGIVPSGVVRPSKEDVMPSPPRVVILVSLDFDKYMPLHQGGNTSAVIFKRVASAAMRYLEVEPDVPEQVEDGNDYFDKIMQEREQGYDDRSSEE